MARKNAATTGVAQKRAPKRLTAKRKNRPSPLDTSDSALADVLKRLKATADPGEIRRLTDRLQRIVFHKQYKNA